MLVTGGKGFIGTNLLNQIEGRSFDVKDSLDIRRTFDVHQHMQEGETVVHLAALSGIPQSIANPLLSHDINVTGTINVLDIARKKGCKVILASSAAAEYPYTPYGAFKATNELYAFAYRQTYGLDVTCLRFANIYGPHSMHKTSVVAQMCKDAIRKGEIYVNGNYDRYFVHVDDVVEAIKMAMNAEPDVYEVSTYKPHSIREIAQIISEETSAKIILRQPRDNDGGAGRPSTWAIEGWEPKIDLHTGVLNTLEWFKKELAND